MSKSEDYKARFKRITGRDMSQAEITEYNAHKDDAFDLYVKQQEVQRIETEKQKIQIPEAPIDPIADAEQKEITRLNKNFADAEALRKQGEEAKAKTREIENEEAKRVREFAEGFFGETEEHKLWRKELYEITNRRGSRPFEGATDKDALRRLELLQKYSDKHYELPQVYSFRKRISYVSENLGLEIVSEDYGHTWKVKASIKDYTETPKLIYDKEGKIIGITRVVKNLTIYDFKKSIGQYADFKIELVDALETPKTTEVPIIKKEVKPFNCEDIDQEHKWFNDKCMVCGEPKDDKKRKE